MNKKKIEKIIMEPIEEVHQISYGYTNQIYSLNNKYILKKCINENNFKNFKRASEFCQRYYKEVNCPRVIYSCLDIESKELWQIEEKAKGENLSFKWGILSKGEKQKVVQKICESMKNIHNIPIEDVFENAMVQSEWKEKFEKDIEKKIMSLEKKGIRYEDLYNKIRVKVQRQINSLNETNFKICHTDMHFDNIIIDENNNITILDYDRLRIASLDYELNIFNVMEKTPALVVNNKIKKRVSKDEYLGILGLMREEYPEMFEFEKLGDRLDIYALKHYLGLLGIVEEKDEVLSELNRLIGEKNVLKPKDVDER